MTGMNQLVSRYFAAWNETADSPRRDLIAATFTDAARYVDPLMKGEGHARIDALIRSVQERFPGHVFSQVGDIDHHQSFVRFSWRLAPAGGTEIVGGTDIARGTDIGVVAEDGRLESVTGFLDPVKPVRTPVVRAPAAFLRTRDGVSLFCKDWGEGEPVVFTAGWALSSHMWQYQVRSLGDHGLRCIAYDRRGHGRSSQPWWGYDYDTLADDLAAVIDQLALRNVTLVGHSMGCGEIIRYVARHGSARVARIALIAPHTPFLLETTDNPLGATAEYFERTRRAWASDFPAWAEDNKLPFFTPETSPAMMNWLVAELLRTPVEVATAFNRAAVATDLRPDLHKIDRPTLVIHGDKDVSAPLDLTGRPTAAGIRQAELRVYEGAPHGLFITHMDRLNRDLLAFARA
jgi:pimeloyl-ACP methyl ester carboxylesterase